MAAAPPLWGVEELERLTGGWWMRAPGPAWGPARVRSTIVGQASPGYLANAILFLTRADQLERLLAGEAPPARPPTGCLVVDRELAASPHLPPHRAVLVVEDCASAIRELAIAARRRMEGRVIVITGTVGKTTTRAMIVHALRRHMRVATNPGAGNYASTVYELMASERPDLAMAVFELGLGGPADTFADVSEVLRPDMFVLTQLDVAHLDAITDEDLREEDALRAVATQKLRLAEGLAPDGVVVLNRDTSIVDEIRDWVAAWRIVTFSAADPADYRLRDYRVGDGVGRVEVEARGERVEYELAVPGRFMAVNSLGAIAAAQEMVPDLHGHAASLSTFEAVKGRARVLDLVVGGAAFKLIDDSYNATPLSIRSTFELLRDTPVPPGGRRVAVLGDIAHLGPGSAETHAGLAGVAVAQGVDRVYTLGPEMSHLQRALPPARAAGQFQTIEAMVAALVGDLRTGDVVTVKASVPSGFPRVVEMLVELHDPTAA